MRTFLFIFLGLPFLPFSQSWSDSLDLNENSRYVFFDSLQGKYGYIQNGEVVIKPKFEDGFSYHSNFATVKKNGKWGAINKKGRWKIAPRYDLMSTIVNGQYLAEKKSIFYWKTVSGKVLYSGKFFKIDYLKLLYYAKQSELEEKELVVRVLEMETSRYRVCGPSEEVINERNITYSHLLIYKYYFTKLFLNGSLSA